MIVELATREFIFNILFTLVIMSSFGFLFMLILSGVTENTKNEEIFANISLFCLLLFIIVIAISFIVNIWLIVKV